MKVRDLYFLFFFTLIRTMASQLLRSSLRAIARPSLVKSFAAPVVARRVPTVAFNATRSFSAALPRMGNGVGKVHSSNDSKVIQLILYFVSLL